MSGFGIYSKSFWKIIFLFSISLPVWSAKAIAEGSVEKSSPEETKPSFLPGLRAFPKEVWPTIIPMNKWESMASAQGMTGIQTTWAPGTSPYQVNPITAIMAAGITLAIQSLREQGRIDHQALWRLLNSTDFYAGIAGSILSNSAKDGAVSGTRKLIGRFTPNTAQAFKDFGSAQKLQLFGNIINAFSYTFAVTAGFEYFSQFWKLATRNVPNVSKVSDLRNASKSDLIRVFSNLFQYFMHADIQKRIISSVKYHRVYTFEFIAMNVGLFVGVFVGDQIAKRIGPKASEATKKGMAQKLTLELGRFLGGISGSIAIQFISDGFKVRVNSALLDWKINKVRDDLTGLMAQMDAGMRYKYYPPYHDAGWGSFFSTQINLLSDVRRLIRTRDLLYSLYAHKFFLVGTDDELLEQIASEQDEINKRMTSWISRTGAMGPTSSEEALDRTLKESSPRMIENQIHDDIHRDEYHRHYGLVLNAGWQSLNSSYQDFEDFIVSLHEFQQEEAPRILRGLPASGE